MIKFLFLIVAAGSVLSCTSQEIQQGVEIFNEGLKSKTLSSAEAGAGLKSALTRGAEVAGSQLSKKNGFYGNSAIKILFPQELRKVETQLRDLGLGALADRTIESFNRAAEKATEKAYPILKSAITEMTIQDAMDILLGDKDAATNYLRNKTTTKLTAAFRPVVKTSADKVYATKYWNQVAQTYNRIPLVKKVPEDITGYITDKTLEGLFYRIEKEEKAIRENPAARVNELLERVFGYADRNSK